MDQGIKSSLTGYIAEHLFYIYCTESGYIVSKPSNPYSKYDAIIDTGKKLIRVQVKSRTISVDGNYKRIIFGKKKYKPGDFDFYAVWVKDFEKWLFIPFSVKMAIKIDDDIIQKYSTFV